MEVQSSSSIFVLKQLGLEGSFKCRECTQLASVGLVLAEHAAKMNNKKLIEDCSFLELLNLDRLETVN